MTAADAPHHSEPDRLPRQLYIKVNEFTLETESTIYDTVVAFTFRGMLNLQRDNAIVICHPLSGSAAVEDLEWWSTLLTRSNPALDPEKYCIICCNSLGSPYGSASPLMYQPGPRGKVLDPYGSAFPKTTIRDDIRIHKRILDILGVRSIHCVMGGGMGGMTALEWAFLGREYVRSVVLISSTARQSAWADARRLGDLHDLDMRRRFPGDGLAPADLTCPLTPPGTPKFVPQTSHALVVRRLWESADERSVSEQENLQPRANFDLPYGGDCLRHMMDKVTSYDVTRDRRANSADRDQALKEVLGRIQQPIFVVGVPKYHIHPLEEQARLFENIPHANFDAVEAEEDGEILAVETEQLDALLHSFFHMIHVHTPGSSD